MPPGPQELDRWKKSTRRPKTSIKVLAAPLLFQVVSTGPNVCGSCESAPRTCTPAFPMYPARVYDVVRPSYPPPFACIPLAPLLTRVHTGRHPPTAAGAARRALHVCARFKDVLARGRRDLFGKPRHVAWQGEPRPRFPAPRRAFSPPRHGRAAHGRAPEVEVAGPNCRAWARRWRALRPQPKWDGQG